MVLILIKWCRYGILFPPGMCPLYQPYVGESEYLLSFVRNDPQDHLGYRDVRLSTELLWRMNLVAMVAIAPVVAVCYSHVSMNDHLFSFFS